MRMWSWTEEVLPFVAMVMITCMDVGVLTVVKAAMNGGMASLVYVVYHNALGTLILLPFFVFHFFRLCLFQVLTYAGINYSSPILSSAIANLTPAYTFLIAIAFRMEKIDIRSSSSQAKSVGTIIAISGALVLTLYKGPEVFQMISSPDSHKQLLLSQPSNWVFGGLILVIAGLFTSIWNVLQTATAREYPDQFTIVFFYCFFGTIQCIFLSLVLERDPSAWVLHPGNEMIAVVLGGVFATAFRSNAVTWCLQKKGPVFVAMFMPISIVVAVIMGVAFLGNSLHLGSVIGAAIIAVGFYTVMWGQAKENKKLPAVEADELGSSSHNTHLLSSENEFKC